MEVTGTLFASASLLVAFLGGMVMLFAPCCITMMLPAYLGTVFKSRFKVLFLTVIFALGVMTVILPIVIGARFIASFLSANHLVVFSGGALLMIAVGLMALFNKPLPIPFVSRLRSPRVTNVASAYALGVVSGATSACCAPVVLGALTLSALSPSLLQAAAVGFAYTLGIVFPLFLLSIFVKRGVPVQFVALQKRHLQLGELRVSLANFLAFVIYSLTGVVMLVLTLTGRLTPGNGSGSFTIQLKALVDVVGKAVEAVPFINMAFAIMLLGFLGYVAYLSRREWKTDDEAQQRDSA